MKRFFYLLLAVAMLASFGCSGDTTVASRDEGTDTVSGILRDPVTNAPIAGATISNGIATCQTKADGSWTLGGFTIPSSGGGGAASASFGGTTVTVPNNNNFPIFPIAITPPAGKGYPNLVYRIVTGSAGGSNNVTIGKLTAKVRGRIVNNDMTPAVGATVYLVYVTDSDTQFSNTAIGTTFSHSATDTTDQNGVFEISGVEAGASVYVYAQSSDRSVSGMWGTALVPGGQAIALANTYDENFVNNLNAQTANNLFVFPTNADLGNVLLPTISVDNGANFTEGLLNGGTFAPGNAIVRFQLNTEIAPNAYANAGQFGGDVWVNAYQKVGNIPASVSLVKNAKGNIYAVDVKFTTSAAMMYEVNIGNNATEIGNVLNNVQAGSLLAKLGVRNGTANCRIVFNTSGGTTADALAGISIPDQGKSYAEDTVVTWTPVAGAVKYQVRVARIIASAKATEELPYVVVDNNNLTCKLQLIPTLQNIYDAGDVKHPLYPYADPATNSIFFAGLNVIKYSVMVIPVGTSGVVDTTKGKAVEVSSHFNATAKIFDGSKVGAPADYSETKKTTDAGEKDKLEGQVFKKDKTLKIRFYSVDPTITEQMSPASFKNAIFGIAKAEAAGGTLNKNILQLVTTSTNTTELDVEYTINVKKVEYDATTQEATLTFNINYTIFVDKLDAKNTQFTFTSYATEYLLSLSGITNLNGKAFSTKNLDY